MSDKSTAKASYIKEYFDDLKRRIAFLSELDGMRRKDEALMLCCCYIEALGSRRSQEPEWKAKNYCDVLAEHGRNEIWPLIHPKKIKNVLSSNGLFGSAFPALAPLIDGFGMRLMEPQEVQTQVDAALNEQQRAWLKVHIFKGSIAYISYERIRSELVHDISAAPISFSETSYKGNPVPDLNFEMLYVALRNIVEISERDAITTNRWWFEQ